MPGAAKEKGMKRSPSEQNGGKGQSDSMKENPWLTFNQSLPCLARVQLSVRGGRRGSTGCQDLLGNTFVTGGTEAPSAGLSFIHGFGSLLPWEELTWQGEG